MSIGGGGGKDEAEVWEDGPDEVLALLLKADEVAEGGPRFTPSRSLGVEILKPLIGGLLVRLLLPARGGGL
jgi:hypothetical protein